MKHRSITTILSVIAFACIVGIPAIARAANFSCASAPTTSVSGTNYNASLTISQLGTTVTLSQASMYVQATSNGSTLLVAPSSSQQGSTATQNIYTFNNLSPSTSYVAYALYPNNGQQASEVVANCNFTTANGTSAGTPTTTNPQTTGTATAGTSNNSAQNTQAQSSTPATPAAPATPSTISMGSIVSPDGDGLVPCDGNDCTVNSVVQLLDNLMSFFFQTLLLPIFVVMVMYLGYSYLTANGKPGQHAKVISMAQHMVGGLVLMLCAWLIVHTILSILGYTDTLGFFGS